jgi:hypothetical protein
MTFLQPVVEVAYGVLQHAVLGLEKSQIERVGAHTE